MYSPTTARETNNILWNNYLALGKVVDLDMMPDETFDAHIECNSRVRELRIAAWLARQGYFIAAWALWEYYSHRLCKGFDKKEQKSRQESSVEWVKKSLAANGRDFGEHEWFSSANCLRNLIAHHAARALDTKAKRLMDRSRKAFPDLETWKDDYLAITHCHVADLKIKIERFIRNTA